MREIICHSNSDPSRFQLNKTGWTIFAYFGMLQKRQKYSPAILANKGCQISVFLWVVDVLCHFLLLKYRLQAMHSRRDIS